MEYSYEVTTQYTYIYVILGLVFSLIVHQGIIKYNTRSSPPNNTIGNRLDTMGDRVQSLRNNYHRLDTASSNNFTRWQSAETDLNTINDNFKELETKYSELSKKLELFIKL